MLKINKANNGNIPYSFVEISSYLKLREHSRMADKYQVQTLERNLKEMFL
jgi:hypothetical protein